MLTLSELKAQKEAEEAAKALAQEQEHQARLAAGQVLFDQIKDIPLFVAENQEDTKDYSVLRQEIRDAISNNSSFPLDLICDHCGTRLYVFVSNVYRLNKTPFDKTFGCPGCGVAGILP